MSCFKQNRLKNDKEYFSWYPKIFSKLIGIKKQFKHIREWLIQNCFVYFLITLFKKLIV